MAIAAPTGFLQYVTAFAQSTRSSLPSLNNRTGKLSTALDKARHPNFIYPLPNPTTAAFDPLKKGLNRIQPESFYGLNSQLVIWAPRIYFNHLDDAAAVKCPLCSKNAGAHGWGNGLRRICGLYGTYYLIGTRHIWRNCEGETVILWLLQD